MIVEVSSLDDPRLDVYARLSDLQLRSRFEPEKGVFIAESDKVIGMALDAGCEPLSLLMEPKWLNALSSLVDRMEAEHPEAPIFVAPQEELGRLVGYDLTRGALGAFRRPVLRSVEEVAAGARRIAVLEEITNYTNVGAIFRSAAGLGMDAVLLTPGCCDPLYRRALRVSMGTALQVPWARIGREGRGSSWAKEGVLQLHDLGFSLVAMALSEDAVPLDDPRLAALDRLAVVLGTEGDGLSRATLARCDWTARIPMSHGVDSLNVAAASAVAFWELRVRE